MERKPFATIVGSIPRLTVTAMFAFAGVAKIADPGTFQLALENYQLVSRPYTYGIALVLPFLEVVVAVALLTSRFRLAAWLLVVPISLGFLVFLGSASVRGLDISCGCFGSGAQGIGLPDWLRAGGTFAVAVFAVLTALKSSLDGQGR